MLYSSLLVKSNDCTVLAASIFRCSYNAFHFTTDIIIIQLPANLDKLVNIACFDHNKITFHIFIEIKHLVVFKKTTFQIHIYDILKSLPIIIALWKKYGIAHGKVSNVIFGRRKVLLG